MKNSLIFEKEEIKKIANLLNFNISFKDSSLEIR